MAEKNLTYKITVDTSEAAQNVTDLDEKSRSASERLDAVGGAGKSIGDGIAAGAGQGAAALNKAGGAMNVAEKAASDFGNAGKKAGNDIKSSVEDAVPKIDSLGTAFATSFTEANEDGKGFFKSFGSGISGAMKSAKSKVSSFVNSTVSGTKKVGNAFLHPIQTIKGSFVSAMKKASKSVDDTGDESKKSEKQLDKMGKSGKGAGDKIDLSSKSASKSVDKVGNESKKSSKELDDMGKSGESAGGKIKSGIEKAIKIMGALAVAATVITGITKFVSAASDASQAAKNVSQSFDQSFGDSAPDVEGWANNFADAVHRSETEVKSFLASNKMLYEGMGITGDAANDLSKMTTSLAYDIGNFAGIDDAEALAQVQDAISGNAQALNEYGVRLDENKLKQTAMAMGLGKNIEEMNEATLAQVRMNAILEQTGDIQQNASSSMGGLQGGIKSLKAAFTDFMEKAGAKLIPLIEKVFGVVLDLWPKIEPSLMSFVDLLTGGFDQAAPIISTLAEDLLPVLFEIIGDIAPVFMEIGAQILPILAQVLGTVGQAVKPLLPLISTLAETILPPLANIFGTLVEKLLPPVASLLGALTPIIDALSPVLELMGGWIGFVADKLASFIGWLTKGVEKVGEFAQKIKDSKVGQFVSGVGDFFSGKSNSSTPAHAKGTDNFEGGWTQVHEAGGELIQAKHGGGMAYLPQGSAVIPASKTDEILSDDKLGMGRLINISNYIQNNETQKANAIYQNNPVLEKDGSTSTGNKEIQSVSSGSKIISFDSRYPKGDNPEDDGKDNNPPPPPPPPPPPDPVSGGGIALVSGDQAAVNETKTVKKVIELNITIKAEGCNITPEVLEEIKNAAKQAAIEAYKEEQDDEMSFLAIQNGFAG